MPQIRFRRAAIKKYTDAYDEQSRAFERLRMPVKDLGGAPTWMQYTLYTETASGLPDQVVDGAGANVYGPFLTYYDNYDTTGSSTMYDEFLKSLTQEGAFISRFQTIKFRQFDEGLHLIRSEFYPTPFNETDAWQNLVTNTTFILENFNARLNLMNDGLRAIFQSSVYVENESQSLNYLSQTSWPQSSWSDLPLPLTTSNTSDFMSVTFGGDAGMIPLTNVAFSNVTVNTASSPVLFEVSYYTNVIVVSVTTTLSGTQTTFKDATDALFSLTGDTTFSYMDEGNPATTVSNFTSTDFSVTITDDFVARFTLTEYLQGNPTEMFVEILE